MRKILTAVFISALIVCLCGCENPENKKMSTTTTAVTTTEQTASETTEQTTSETTTEQTASETTTGKVGGFIVYDEAPGADITWEDIGAEE